MTKRNILQDFWKFVDKKGSDECWEWKGSRKGTRYGRFRINNIRYKAHRISYQLHYGKINPKMEILHNCDNGFCVNPRHLREGTQKENIRDMWLRDRANKAKGERVNTAKLTWEQVREIRKRYIPFKVSTVKLGKEYGVSDSAIGAVVGNKTWRE